MSATATGPHLPTADEVRATAALLEPFVRVTPILRVHDLQGAEGCDLTLKLEQLQVTGTFKARGAFATLLGADVPAAGVVGASGGNFGLAWAHAAATLGHRATIFVPATSPAEKIDGIRALGAEVHVIDGYYAEALAAAEEHVERTGALAGHAYDAPGMVVGAATLGLEIEEQVGVPDTILVAVGGGGLVAGLASWFRDRCRIVAVETETTATLHTALQAGGPCDVEVGGLAASSLGARRLGEHAWAVRGWVDRSLLVSDDDVRTAQQALWRTCRVVAEPGGAVATASLTSAAYLPSPGERVLSLVCGANVDPAKVRPARPNGPVTAAPAHPPQP